MSNNYDLETICRLDIELYFYYKDCTYVLTGLMNKQLKPYSLFLMQNNLNLDITAEIGRASCRERV